MLSKKPLAAGAAIAVAAFGVAAVADAASTKKHATRHSTNASSTRTNTEATLTGDDATKAKDAAVAATGGGTAWRASKEDPSDSSGAVYEVHVTKTDGTEVEVLEDSSFNVIKVQASQQRHGRHGGRGHDGGPASEPALTGDDATKAKDAAVAATGGGTAWRASKEDPSDSSGAAYEVHVTKTDGTEVEVLEDSSFNVIKVQTSPQHAGNRH